MLFRKVIFTHPITVFPSEHDYGSLMTEDNQSGRKVDSLEAREHWVIIRRGSEVRAIPAAKVESAEVLEDELDVEHGAEPVRRGPGRPRKNPEVAA